MDFIDEIQEINRTYLFLARKLIRKNISSASLKLGVSVEIAELIGSFSDIQISDICNSCLTIFSFNSSAIPLLLKIGHPDLGVLPSDF